MRLTIALTLAWVLTFASRYFVATGYWTLSAQGDIALTIFVTIGWILAFILCILQDIREWLGD